jgi:hypothetical protein
MRCDRLIPQYSRAERFVTGRPPIPHPSGVKENSLGSSFTTFHVGPTEATTPGKKPRNKNHLDAMRARVGRGHFNLSASQLSTSRDHSALIGYFVSTVKVPTYFRTRPHLLSAIRANG